MKKPHSALPILVLLLLLFGSRVGGLAQAVELVVVPSQGEILSPFSGNDLTGMTTWLESSGLEDPNGVFSIDGQTIHLSGEGMGYLATNKAYRDYHLSLEYRWGTRHDGSGYVRNSGILLHATGPHGNANGRWMASIECQLAQGCEGDLIVIRGKDAQGEEILTTLMSDTRTAGDGKTRWDPQGDPTPYAGKQFWWSNHQQGFSELRDARGKDDVASALEEWTRVECLCRGNEITIKINGVVVNHAYAVSPTAGKILLENEGNEIEFRNVTLRPLTHPDTTSSSTPESGTLP